MLAYFVGAILVLTSAACGAGYECSLKLSDGQRDQAVKSRDPTVRKPTDRRAAMEGRAGSKFTATWKVVRSARDESKDVLVHFYVVRIGRAGEAPPPLEPAKVVIESALTMDFPPGESGSATLEFRIEHPGVYLVRIEARPNSEEPGHEDYAAVDLVIK